MPVIFYDVLIIQGKNSFSRNNKTGWSWRRMLGNGRDAIAGQHLIYLGIFNPLFILQMRIKFMVRGHHEYLNYFYRIIEWQGAC